MPQVKWRGPPVGTFTGQRRVEFLRFRLADGMAKQLANMHAEPLAMYTLRRRRCQLTKQATNALGKLASTLRETSKESSNERRHQGKSSCGKRNQAGVPDTKLEAHRSGAHLQGPSRPDVDAPPRQETNKEPMAMSDTLRAVLANGCPERQCLGL